MITTNFVYKHEWNTIRFNGGSFYMPKQQGYCIEPKKQRWNIS
jgi:hypothetical protein